LAPAGKAAPRAEHRITAPPGRLILRVSHDGGRIPGHWSDV